MRCRECRGGAEKRSRAERIEKKWMSGLYLVTRNQMGARARDGMGSEE